MFVFIFILAAAENQAYFLNIIQQLFFDVYICSVSCLFHCLALSVSDCECRLV